MMALIHSKNTIIKLGSVDLSAYVKSSEFARKADVHDVTTYGKADHVYAGGLGDGTFKMDGIYDSTATTGPRAAIEPLIGTEVVLTRQPEGTGSGKAQDVVDIIVTGYTESSPVADYVTWSMDAQLSDAVSSTAQSV
jgi:hypothetical protein